MTIPTFPALPGLLFPVKRSPSGKSVRQESISGRRTVLPLRTIPRWSWEIDFEFLRNALYGGGFTELEQLTAFYLAQMMGGTCFAYNEVNDNTATLQGFGVGDGATTQFQLVRARGGYTEPVYLASITGLTVGGVAKTSPANYTLGPSGIVTFTSAPASLAALVWTGTYTWLCRFDEDSLNLTDFMQGLSDAKALKFSSEINP